MSQTVASGAKQASIEHELDRRFGGTARLYGDLGFARINASHICVVGIGGVGSWVVESLARSGVGTISMIDMDVVSISNVNRQIHAGTDTRGQNKVQVMRDRIRQINPVCRVKAVDDFISCDNLTAHIGIEHDMVIDCIDDFRIKAALINYCKQRKIDILTVGGAAGKMDPEKIRRADLSKSRQDVLLAKTRKLLRQNYAFSRNLKRSFGVPCVYSQEQIVFPDGQGGVSTQRPETSENDQLHGLTNALSCAGGIGSVSHVTATFGLFASAYALNQIADDH